MLNGKKGIESFIIVLFIIIAISAVLGGGINKNVALTMGTKQAVVMSSYTEAEKIREYLDQSARFALLEAAQEAGAATNGRAECFSVSKIDSLFKEKIIKYLNQDVSSNPNLNAILPKITWTTLSNLNTLTATGTAGQVSVVATDFDYSAGIYVNQAITCEDYKEFYNARKSLV